MKSRKLTLDPFRFDDLESWRQLLRKLQGLRELNMVSGCEALRLPVGLPDDPGRTRVSAVVGASDTHANPGSRESVLAPVDVTMDATPAS
jgi:hypothetical protein